MLTSELIRLEMKALSTKKAENWIGSIESKPGPEIRLTRKSDANSILFFTIPFIIWLLSN
ncbi:MAG: hypothetical protein JEZ06_04160 [Anaerolineaceae bacterium]|nr:hypothetical protein [Anaerolineaceae bacterium]